MRRVPTCRGTMDRRSTCPSLRWGELKRPECPEPILLYLFYWETSFCTFLDIFKAVMIVPVDFDPIKDWSRVINPTGPLWACWTVRCNKKWLIHPASAALSPFLFPPRPYGIPLLLERTSPLPLLFSPLFCLHHPRIDSPLSFWSFQVQIWESVYSTGGNL